MRQTLRSTTAELIRVKRHKFPDAHRRPAGHPLHAVRQPVIPTRPVQLGHRHQMPGQVLRQPRLFQLPFPILGGMSEYVTSRFSASEYSRATPCMSCDRGPVSS